MLKYICLIKQSVRNIQQLETRISLLKAAIYADVYAAMMYEYLYHLTLCIDEGI